MLSDWQTIDDINKLPYPALQELIKNYIEQIRKENSEIKSERCFTLPTDGTMLETELAYCSSCDAERMMELQLMLDKTKAETNKMMVETELMKLEIERRKKLLEAGDLNLFDQPVATS